jgi:hypothetical protein
MKYEHISWSATVHPSITHLEIVVNSSPASPNWRRLTLPGWWMRPNSISCMIYGRMVNRCLPPGSHVETWIIIMDVQEGHYKLTGKVRIVSDSALGMS